MLIAGVFKSRRKVGSPGARLLLGPWTQAPEPSLVASWRCWQWNWKDPLWRGGHEINTEHSSENEQKLFPEFATARESATITCIWQKVKGKPWLEEPYREAFKCALIGGFVGMENLEVSESEVGYPRRLPWLSLVEAELELRTKTWEAGMTVWADSYRGCGSQFYFHLFSGHWLYIWSFKRETAPGSRLHGLIHFPSRQTVVWIGNGYSHKEM